jgi:hypothetical protein
MFCSELVATEVIKVEEMKFRRDIFILKTSIGAPKPIFRLDFEHLYFDNHIKNRIIKH